MSITILRSPEHRTVTYVLTGDKGVAHVWYDPHTRSWVTYRVDADGFQDGEAYYTGQRSSAISQAEMWTNEGKVS